ncbi:DUF3135 domain-containing protein [Vibrio sp.]|uniref:DUF3135 domain-containing protein n=1 Tax=Vibrio sp. TaxID=678 RepID=UPI003D13A818
MSAVYNRENQTLPSFDELVALAKTDPEQLTRMRQSMCAELIQSASPEMQQRLRAQQSHIELIISRGKNPNQVNVMLMRELYRQLFKFQQSLNGNFTELYNSEAAVLPFKPRDEEWR